MGARRRQEQIEADRIKRWDLVKAALLCVVWMLASLFLLGSAMHTTDETIGRMFFWGGLIVGNVGIVVTLARAYLRGERRGDW